MNNVEGFHYILFGGAIAIFLLSYFLSKKIKSSLIENPSYLSAYMYSFLFLAKVITIILAFSYILLYVVPGTIIDFFGYIFTVIFTISGIFIQSIINGIESPYNLPISYLAMIILNSLMIAVISSIPTYIIAKNSKSSKKIIVWQFIALFAWIVLFFIITATLGGFNLG